MSPPYGLAPNPIPCDDFFPTNFTGNSFPTGSGPARNAAAETENSLKMAWFDLRSGSEFFHCFVTPEICQHIYLSVARGWK